MLADLISDLRDSRDRSTRVYADLEGERLLGPKLAIVNPPLWEIGHVGWFQEHWCLRSGADGSRAPSSLAGADALYDSSTVPHATRWDLPLPDIDATARYLGSVLERVLERVAREGATPHLSYFAQLAAFHEEMHCEAFTYTRQTLSYRGPPAAPAARAARPHAGDVEVTGGELLLGAPRDAAGFVFD